MTTHFSARCILKIGGLGLSLLAWIVLAIYVHKPLMRFVRGGTHESTVTVVIEKGYGANKTAWTLKRAHVIDDAIFFRAMVVALGAASRLKAGSYRIPAHASPLSILRKIIQGQAELHRITIPEGITLAEAITIINNAPHLKGKVTIPLREGMLLPETYFYGADKSRNELAAIMKQAATKVLHDAWQQRADNLPLKTPEEALILASIVEKETAVSYERTLVAGVFIHRLRQNMKLQSDPTVIYGITEGQSSSLDRSIRLSDLERKTDWNTYTIRGLPATPICLPGQASIEAVTMPEETNLLYFVADGRGGHIFAATLKGHEDNVKKWRSIERTRAETKRIKQIAEDTKDIVKRRPWSVAPFAPPQPPARQEPSSNDQQPDKSYRPYHHGN